MRKRTLALLASTCHHITIFINFLDGRAWEVCHKEGGESCCSFHHCSVHRSCAFRSGTLVTELDFLGPGVLQIHRRVEGLVSLTGTSDFESDYIWRNALGITGDVKRKTQRKRTIQRRIRLHEHSVCDVERDLHPSAGAGPTWCRRRRIINPTTRLAPDYVRCRVCYAFQVWEN